MVCYNKGKKSYGIELVSYIMNVIQGQFVKEVKQQRAKELRRTMTRAEKILWSNLRNNQLSGFHFRRQQVIAGFIVDFYCCRAKLIVEVDGKIHEMTKEYDAERDNILKSKGFQILRLKNETLFRNLPEALKSILEICQNYSSD